MKNLIDTKLAGNERAALRIIEKVKEENRRRQDELQKAPKYFQELFAKYPILKKFDIKQIMSKNYVRALFLKVAKECIYADVNSAKLKIKEIKNVLLETRFPIVFVIAGTVKSIIRLVGGYSLNPYFQLIKFSVYWYWLKESFRINALNFRS